MNESLTPFLTRFSRDTIVFHQANVHSVAAGKIVARDLLDQMNWHVIIVHIPVKRTSSVPTVTRDSCDPII